MSVETAHGRPVIFHKGVVAPAAFCVLVAAWLAFAGSVATVLLSNEAHAAVARWIDARQITVPMLGHLDGEALLTRMQGKAVMIVFAILPVLLLETASVTVQETSAWRLVKGRSISSLTDLGLYLLNLLGLWRYLTIVLTFGTVFLSGLAVAGIAGAILHFQLRIRTGSLVIDCVLAFLLFSFCDYWNHRLQHTSPLWPLHRIHHAAQEMTVFTLWRQHPAIAAIEPLIKLWPFALFDIPAGVIGTVATITVAYEHLIHSNVRWTWGWFGRWILIPPMGHRLHHHIEPANQWKNLGIVAIWDRLFGTWDGQSIPDGAMGVTGLEYNRGRPLHELWRDLVEFLALIRHKVEWLVHRRHNVL